MSVRWALLFSLLPIVSCYAPYIKEHARLNSTENKQLQATCGRNTRYQMKTLDGERSIESPWAGSVNIYGILSSTVISPRHILLFNLIQLNVDTLKMSILNETVIAQESKCDKSDLLLPHQINDWFQVDFVAKQMDKAYKHVQRIYTIDGCDELDTYKPMIIELEYDMWFDKAHGAACLPKPISHSDIQEFTVFGLGPNETALTSTRYAKEACEREHAGNSVFCGRPLKGNRRLCAGDFGAGAVATIDGRNVVLGIYAEGNTDCDLEPETQSQAEFIDLSAYTEKLCRQTGICVDQLEETTAEPSTSTDGYYISGEEGSGESQGTEGTEQPVTTDASIEAIVAETFEKIKLSCSTEAEKDIHIHIRLEKDVVEKLAKK